jgi:hypothetical protein
MKKVNKQKKDAMIEALTKSLGVVTTACNLVGIEPKTHYNWLKDDPDYAQAVADVKNTALDFVESQQFKRIKEGSDTMIIWYLKTQGKQRGYTEKVQVEHSGAIEIDLTKMTNEELDTIISNSGKG